MKNTMTCVLNDEPDDVKAKYDFRLLKKRIKNT